MKLNEARSTLRVQQETTDVIRNRFCRRERIEHRLRANAKVFTRALDNPRDAVESNATTTQALQAHRV